MAEDDDRTRLLRFVERFALALRDAGMAPMAARVLAYALADDADRYTAGDLASGPPGQPRGDQRSGARTPPGPDHVLGPATPGLGRGRRGRSPKPFVPARWARGRPCPVAATPGAVPATKTWACRPGSLLG